MDFHFPLGDGSRVLSVLAAWISVGKLRAPVPCSYSPVAKPLGRHVQ